jgi:hypothetical protein
LEEVRDAHLDGAVSSALDYRADIPPAVKSFVLRLMARKPEERFQTATEAKQAFFALQAPQSQVVKKVGPHQSASAMETELSDGAETITQKFQRMPATRRIVYASGAAALLLGIAAAVKPRDVKPDVPTNLEATAKENTGYRGVHADLIPQKSHLHLHVDAGFECFHDKGVKPSIDGDRVDIWRDLSPVGGENTLEYSYTTNNEIWRLARLPYVGEVNPDYGIGSGWRRVRFEKAHLNLISERKDVPEVGAWNQANMALLNGQRVTLAFLLRNRTTSDSDRTVLLGCGGTNHKPTWEIWSQGRSYCIGLPEKPQDVATVTLPDEEKHFSILICSVDRESGAIFASLSGGSGPEQVGNKGEGFQWSGTTVKARLGAEAYTTPDPKEPTGILQAFNGDVTEFMIYDNLLQSDERRQLIAYYRKKYFSR